MINCQQCRQHLDDLALQHDAAVPPLVRKHLDECPDCRQMLEQLCDAWALLPLTLDPEQVSAALTKRVMSRVDEPLVQPVSLPQNSLRSTRRHTGLLLQYGMTAAVLIAIVTPILVWSHRQSTAIYLEQQQAFHVQQRLDQFNDLQRGFGHPQLRFVSFQTRASQAHAYMLHDALAEEGHFFAFGLPQLSGQQCYMLWILDNSDRVVATKVLDVDGEGNRQHDNLDSGPESTPPRQSVATGLKLLVTMQHDSAATFPSQDVRLQAEAQ